MPKNATVFLFLTLVTFPAISNDLIEITAPDAEMGDLFGSAVAVDRDTMAVGAISDDNAEEASGSVYIFSRNQGGADSWGFVTRVFAPDGGLGDYFGNSVSLSGDILVVGAIYADDVGEDSGSAYIFSRNHGGADQWG